MEQELYSLQQMPRYPYPASSDSNVDTSSQKSALFSPVGNDASSPSSSDSSHDAKAKKQQHVIVQDDNKGYLAAAYQEYDSSNTDQSSNWVLTVSNGTISIRTPIRTHSELLKHLEKILATLEFQDTVPAMFSHATDPNPMLKVLRMILWKRYGKSRYKYKARTAAITDGVTDAWDRLQVFDENATALRLLEVYMNCQNLLLVPLHRPTFYALFVDGKVATASPAVTALCAFSCINSCRHLYQIAPKDCVKSYSKFYIDLAREQLSERFDEISLEVFIAYVFVALYYIRNADLKTGLRFADMAERISHVLDSTYNRYYSADNKSDPLILGKSALFLRMLHVLWRAQMLGRLLARAEAQKDGKKDKMDDFAKRYAAIQEPNPKLAPIPGDSYEEARFIMGFLYMHELRLVAHKIVNCFESDSIWNFVGNFGHQLEMMIRKWYNETLPLELKLSLPLFDDTIPEETYVATLERACAVSMVPAWTTIRAYVEYLILAKAYVPKPKYMTNRTPPTTTDDHFTCRKKHHIDKVLRLKKEVDFDGTDMEFVSIVFGSLHFDMSVLKLSILDLSVRSAALLLRLYRFLQSRQHPVCLVDKMIAVDTWETMARIGKLYYSESQRATEATDRIWKLLQEYLDFIHLCAEHDPGNPEFEAAVAELDQEFEKELHILALSSSKEVNDDLPCYVNL